MGLFEKFLSGINKTRENFLGRLDDLFSRFKKVDEELFDELEEILIMADIGVNTVMDITEKLKARVKKENIGIAIMNRLLRTCEYDYIEK